MYPAVESVEVATPYRLIIGFDNGERRVFDLTPLLTIGRFRSLAAPDEFQKVRVVFDTVAWDNGMDLDPEYLYEQSVPQP
jgi:hypothetical protein